MAGNEQLNEVRSALLKFTDRLSSLQRESPQSQPNQTTRATTVASEQRKLFGYNHTKPNQSNQKRRQTSRNQSSSKGKNTSTSTLKFVCLSSKNAAGPPASVSERTALANKGLGDRSITFSCEDSVYEGILTHYPALKHAGGFELCLFQRGGGEDGGFHVIQPPHAEKRLKELAGQAKIYIKPLQRDIFETKALNLESLLQDESQVASADPTTMAELKQDDRFITSCSECGITTILSEENKNITVQSMLLYHVINRKKVLLDQLRCGLKDVNVLEYIEKYPTLFEPLFVHSSEMTADAVKGLFKTKNTLTEKQETIWGYLMSFVDKCTKEDMKDFVRFLTGCKTISAAGICKKAIEVSFTQEGAIFSSTCLLQLQLPEEVESFDVFEVALRTVVNEGSDKSFNVV